jgi:hypothetical protein
MSSWGDKERDEAHVTEDYFGDEVSTSYEEAIGDAPANEEARKKQEEAWCTFSPLL